ncbi:MAG: hypothetical protein II297_03475, partial [Clostridia bacterium]|nr:hypothetical protein [Clostridia bacterium]
PFLYHLRWDFFVSFLLFLLSQKKKQEKPDGKRKKKKGYRSLAGRFGETALSHQVLRPFLVS